MWCGVWTSRATAASSLYVGLCVARATVWRHGAAGRRAALADSGAGGGAAAVVAAVAQAVAAAPNRPEIMAAFGGGGRGGGGGAFALPGKYTVSLAKRVNGVVTELAGSETSKWRGHSVRRKSGFPWWSSRKSWANSRRL